MPQGCASLLNPGSTMGLVKQSFDISTPLTASTAPVMGRKNTRGKPKLDEYAS